MRFSKRRSAESNRVEVKNDSRFEEDPWTNVENTVIAIGKTFFERIYKCRTIRVTISAIKYEDTEANSLVYAVDEQHGNEARIRSIADCRRCLLSDSVEISADLPLHPV